MRVESLQYFTIMLPISLHIIIIMQFTLCNLHNVKKVDGSVVEDVKSEAAFHHRLCNAAFSYILATICSGVNSLSSAICW